MTLSDRSVDSWKRNRQGGRGQQCRRRPGRGHSLLRAPFWPCGWPASPGEEEPLVLAPARALSLFELPAYSSLNFPALLGASRPGFRSVLWLPKLYDFETRLLSVSNCKMAMVSPAYWILVCGYRDYSGQGLRARQVI